MLLPYLLTALLPSASAAPLTDPNPEPYNCGYVLTEHNSSAYAGIYAHGFCEPIYYNETIRDFQDAYAYRMYGGCACQFYGYVIVSPCAYCQTRQKENTMG